MATFSFWAEDYICWRIYVVVNINSDYGCGIYYARQDSVAIAYTNSIFSIWIPLNSGFFFIIAATFNQYSDGTYIFIYASNIVFIRGRWGGLKSGKK